MKKILILSSLLLCVGLTNFSYSQNLPVVNKSKQTFNVYMDNNDDVELTYGYETASTSSKKMICFSSFTADVENNPHKCVLGAYYTTDEIEVQYLGIEGSFVKLKLNGTIFYVETKMVKFE